MPDIIKQTKNYNIIIYSEPNIENNKNYYLMIVDGFNGKMSYNKYLQINYNKLYKILNIILENEDVINYLGNCPKIITMVDLERINLWQTIN